MKVFLVTGAKGMLGKAIVNRFKDEELICTDVDELDITDFDAVLKFVKKAKPDVIINCAAYTAVDKAEENEEEAYKVNCIGPENLARTSAEVGSILVHVSTDYVYDGDLSLDFIYKENDEKNPQTVYGRTKLSGENAIKKFTTRYYIFRTAWLYGDGPNFVRTMLKIGKEKEKVKVVYDQYGSPTYAVDLANMIYQALEKNIPMGIYNATNLGFLSWFDFTREIYKMAGIKCEVDPVTSEEFKRPAKRPYNSMMSKAKLLEEDIDIPTWRNAMERYLKIETKK